MTQAPAACPSRPSVRFTPLLAAAIITVAQRVNSATPMTAPYAAKSTQVSRTKETRRLAGAMPSRPRRVARTAKTTATDTWPSTFCFEVSPSERSLRILLQSSRKPTKPTPTMRNRTNRPGSVGGTQVSRCAAAYPSAVAAMMTKPPIWGVPRLVWWLVGPSSRTNWPQPLRRATRM
jgi:hypothetical protein